MTVRKWPTASVEPAIWQSADLSVADPEATGRDWLVLAERERGACQPSSHPLGIAG
jgi:hypothetical protein